MRTSDLKHNDPSVTYEDQEVISIGTRSITIVCPIFRIRGSIKTA